MVERQDKNAKQLDFLYLAEHWRKDDIDDSGYAGTVVQLASGDWQAKINNGWWQAIRETKQAAINAVVDIYRKEAEKYG